MEREFSIATRPGERLSSRARDFDRRSGTVPCQTVLAEVKVKGNGQETNDKQDSGRRQMRKVWRRRSLGGLIDSTQTLLDRNARAGRGLMYQIARWGRVDNAPTQDAEKKRERLGDNLWSGTPKKGMMVLNSQVKSVSAGARMRLCFWMGKRVG